MGLYGTSLGDGSLEKDGGKKSCGCEALSHRSILTLRFLPVLEPKRAGRAIKRYETFTSL